MQIDFLLKQKKNEYFKINYSKNFQAVRSIYNKNKRTKINVFLFEKKSI